MTDLITADDEIKLRHMLGVSEKYKKREWGFRNYYATSVGNSQASMKRLVLAGLAVKGQSSAHMDYYHATLAGCKHIGLTKAQINRVFED